MKILLLVLAFYVAVTSADVLGQLQQCVKNEGIDSHQIGGVVNAVTGTDTDPPRNIKCFITCILETIGKFIDNTLGIQTINIKAIKILIKEWTSDDKDVNHAIETLEKCMKSIESSERCERTWDFSRCISRALM